MTKTASKPWGAMGEIGNKFLFPIPQKKLTLLTSISVT
jgi:hypothetical protein